MEEMKGKKVELLPSTSVTKLKEKKLDYDENPSFLFLRYTLSYPLLP